MTIILPPPTAIPPPTPGVLVIGASTGGPAALKVLLPQLPADFAAPVLVAQHLPAHFITTLAVELAKVCRLPVQIGRADEPIRAGTIYLAPGSGDMTITRDPATRSMLALAPSLISLTPSVNALLASAASVYGAATTAIILTGMGQDGLTGAQAVKAAGGTVLVQDEATSAIYGMGRTVVEHGLADRILPLDRLIDALANPVSPRHG